MSGLDNGSMFLLKNSTSSQIVLNAVRRNYPVSRFDISEITNLSVPSVSRILSKLMEDGYVDEIDTVSKGVGRKTKLITLKDRCVLTAGIEYDNAHLKAAIVDEKARIIAYRSYALKGKGIEPLKLSQLIYEKVQELFQEEGIAIERLFGIGVALPGMVNNETGEVMLSAQLGWHGVKFKEMMEQVSGVNCIVENDIKAAAVAEYNKGSAINSKVTVLLYFGSGLGSAVIIDGVLFRGASNSAGELGHITQDVNGVLCNCGKAGCLQTHIAEYFIVAEARKFAEIDSMKELFEENIRNQKWAEKIISRFVTYSALAIDTAVCAYNPDTLILCGDIVSNTPVLFENIKKAYYSEYVSGYHVAQVEIKKSAFNGKGSAVGSGMLAAEKFFQTV